MTPHTLDHTIPPTPHHAYHNTNTYVPHHTHIPHWPPAWMIACSHLGVIGALAPPTPLV